MLQTKETLTLRSTAFGSKPVIPESLLKKVEGLVKEQILEFANLKQNKELAKTDGSKRSRIRGNKAQDEIEPCVTLAVQLCLPCRRMLQRLQLGCAFTAMHMYASQPPRQSASAHCRPS